MDGIVWGRRQIATIALASCAKGPGKNGPPGQPVQRAVGQASGQGEGIVPTCSVKHLRKTLNIKLRIFLEPFNSLIGATLTNVKVSDYTDQYYFKIIDPFFYSSGDVLVGDWTEWSCNSECYNPGEKMDRKHNQSRTRSCKDFNYRPGKGQREISHPDRNQNCTEIEQTQTAEGCPTSFPECKNLYSALYHCT